jgi:hypothetical protein
MLDGDTYMYSDQMKKCRYRNQSVIGMIRYRTGMTYTRMPVQATSASRADAQLWLVYCNCNYMYHTGFFSGGRLSLLFCLLFVDLSPNLHRLGSPEIDSQIRGISGPYPRLRCLILVPLWLFLKASVRLKQV